MIFLANRANLDKRHLLSRLHNWLQMQITAEESPIEQVWYHTSAGNKVGVRARINAPGFLGTTYSVEEAELHVSFDFPVNRAYDFYRIQWVETEREFMLGWHQDETHMDLGECHIQLDYNGESVQRESATFLDRHPMNVFDQRITDLVDLVDTVSWETDRPRVPKPSSALIRFLGLVAHTGEFRRPRRRLLAIALLRGTGRPSVVRRRTDVQI